MHAPKETWAAELAAYEREKRHAADATTLRGASSCPSLGSSAFQGRIFDPLLQRFREPQVESRRRGLEDQERVAHLNRAQDIQVMREAPYNILTHESKLEVLAPGEDPLKLCGTLRRGAKPARQGRPLSDSVPEKDFHIVSNLPISEHHWRSAERSFPKEEPVVPRKLHSHLVKDFNIVTNRYNEHHEEKDRQARHLTLLEGTQKYMRQNRFDPVTQLFNDPRHEEMARAAGNAREVEVVMRKQAELPPAYRGRQTEHYGIVSHITHNEDVMKVWDGLEGERKERYKNRYIVEHNVHVQEVRDTHVANSRRLNRVAPERFEETSRRGYDIIDNASFGPGAKDKQLHKPFTKDRMTPWEKAVERIPTSAPGWGSGSGISRGSFAGGRSVAAPPPAPAIPGAAVGSVFSHPKDR